jgi:ribosome-associated protein
MVMDGPLEHRRGAGRGYHTSSPFTLLSFTMRAHRASDDDVAPASDDSAPDRPSKTQLKKASHELQDLGEALVEMPDDRLAGLEIDESLRDAIHAYKHTRSHEGRRRQMQYIGKLMRRADVAPLREAVAAMQLGRAKDALALHEAERWRAELIGDDDALTRWSASHPASDLQQLRSLVRAARKDAAAAPEQRSGRAYRDLFKFIRDQHGD